MYAVLHGIACSLGYCTFVATWFFASGRASVTTLVIFCGRIEYIVVHVPHESWDSRHCNVRYAPMSD